MSHCRHGLAVTVRLPWRASFWNGIAGQAERHVECDATDDVGADAQPIRGQVRVADPCLIRFSLAGCGKRGVATQALSSFSILCSGKTVTGIVLGPTN